MRKLLSVFLVLCLALLLFPAAALAADVVDSGVGADGIRWSFSRDGVLTVTGSGSMRNYDESEIYMDEDNLRKGECIACEHCANGCPHGNLSRWDRKITRAQWIPVLIKASLLFALGAALGLCRFLPLG